MSSVSSGKKRFLGWQATPVQQSSFGRSTKGGAANQKVSILHSTGPKTESVKRWFLLDASEVPVGRLATTAASILMGKHDPSFTPGSGSKDYVLVVNADKAFFTSNKSDKKIYYRHTGYLGGLKMQTAGEALEKHSDKVIYDAVYGMMPKSRLSAKQLRHLKIYKGAEHSMLAQKPQKIDLKDSRMALKAIGYKEGA